MSLLRERPICSAQIFLSKSWIRKWKLSETEAEAVQNNITVSETAFGHAQTHIMNICNDCINIYNCRKVMPTLSIVLCIKKQGKHSTNNPQY